MSQDWKHLNEEEQAFFKEAYEGTGRGTWKFQPGCLEKLATRPVTRVAWWWKFAEGRHALSPFAIAGITKHSPQEVLEQLLVERADGSRSSRRGRTLVRWYPCQRW